MDMEIFTKLSEIFEEQGFDITSLQYCKDLKTIQIIAIKPKNKD